MSYREDRLREEMTVWARSRRHRFSRPSFAVGVPSMGLQAQVNALGANGGTVEIGDGLFYAVTNSPATALIIPGGVTILGQGMGASIIGSPIVMNGSQSGLVHLTARAPSATVGVRIYNGGSPFIARCFFDHVFVGASFKDAGDGPVNGIELDGTGVLMAEQLTCAFCTGHGLLADSTGLEPNTTLLGDCCSFVQNGGFGVRLLQSLTIAKFTGGNMESNGSGELYAENAGVISLDGVDFERGPYGNPPVSPPSINNMMEMQNCNSIRLVGNNWVKTSSATRSWLLQGCSSIEYEGNRFEGFGAAGVLRISESCTGVRRGVNHIVGSAGWIEDYSR
jgi:hypothetical protein